MKMKLLSTVICFGFLLGTLSSCATNNDSSTYRSPSTEINTSVTIDRVAADRLSAAIKLALDGYDVSVSTLDIGNDGKLDVSVTIRGGNTLYKYIYGFVVDKTMKEINREPKYYQKEIGLVTINGTSEERAFRWTTTNLSSGTFVDSGGAVYGLKKYDDMTFEKVLEYCEYVSPEDLLTENAENKDVEKDQFTEPIDDNKEKESDSKEAEVSTDSVQNGAIVYSRAGTQYYQYGTLDYGTTVEIIKYENDKWVNLIYYQKNAYIEAKYYSPISTTAGVIIDPGE